MEDPSFLVNSHPPHPRDPPLPLLPGERLRPIATFFRGGRLGIWTSGSSSFEGRRHALIGSVESHLPCACPLPRSTWRCGCGLGGKKRVLGVAENVTVTGRNKHQPNPPNSNHAFCHSSSDNCGFHSCPIWLLPLTSPPAGSSEWSSVEVSRICVQSVVLLRFSFPVTNALRRSLACPNRCQIISPLRSFAHPFVEIIRRSLGPLQDHGTRATRSSSYYVLHSLSYAPRDARRCDTPMREDLSSDQSNTRNCKL